MTLRHNNMFWTSAILALALILMSGWAALLCQRQVAALAAEGIGYGAETMRNITAYGLGANLVIGVALIMVMQWLLQRQSVGRARAQRAQAEERLQASLIEKEILLEEIHHRVKNNLQVVSSLLNLQSDYINDPRDLDLFRESQNRIKSMALVHESLYQSDNLARINFGNYLNQLVPDVYQSYGISPSEIGLRIEVDPGIQMSMDTAIPCGLIVNELVSNALKYAFPAAVYRPAGKKEQTNPCGEIQISLKSDGADHLLLQVKDNGVGLPPEFDMAGLASLGLKLVTMLTAQIQGAFTREQAAGTSWCIRIPTYTI